MASTAKYYPPPPFSFKAEEWKDWLEDFRDFRILTKAQEENGEFQVTSLRKCMGDPAKKIFKAFKYGKKKVKRTEQQDGQPV